MVVVAVTGEVNPVATKMYPVVRVYQLTVLPFAPAVAVRVPEQMTVAFDAAGVEGIGAMVTVTGTLPAVLSHPVVVL